MLECKLVWRIPWIEYDLYIHFFFSVGLRVRVRIRFIVRVWGRFRCRVMVRGPIVVTMDSWKEDET